MTPEETIQIREGCCGTCDAAFYKIGELEEKIEELNDCEEEYRLRCNIQSLIESLEAQLKRMNQLERRLGVPLSREDGHQQYDPFK